MATSSQKNKKEKLFDELISVKILHKKKEKELKNSGADAPGYETLKKELSDLKKKIAAIEKAISKYGESFLDVYDSELINPLTESDIIVLRDEISEIRNSLEAFREHFKK
ncbi:MAG: hypothetical protein ACQETJ_06525 [Bacteroidota bacterium]